MFRPYQRKQVAELRPITPDDIAQFEQYKMIVAHQTSDNWIPVSISTVSISTVEISAGSPKLGDMVARNPKNHLDQWLVSKQYFEDNFESMGTVDKCAACDSASLRYDKHCIGMDDVRGSFKDLTFQYCELCGDVFNVDFS